MPIRRALRLYLAILFAIFVVEWGFAALSLHRHWPYPYTTPLFHPRDRFGDWTNYLPRIAHIGQPNVLSRPDLGAPLTYPLPSLFIYLAFVRLFANPTHAFICVTILAFVAAFAGFSVYLYRIGAPAILQTTVWATLLLGSPALFLLDRGNIEIFVWLAVILGLAGYSRDWKYCAALCFGLAAALKIYPALYLLLFVPRRQWRALVAGVCAAGAISLLALAAVGPAIPAALHDLGASAHYLRDTEIVPLDEPGLRFDHSLLAVIKRVLFFASPNRGPSMTFPTAVQLYSLVVPLAFAIFYWLRLRRLPVLNQFAALAICSVLLPFVSYDYTLVHMYAVFAAFLLYLLQDSGTLSPSRLTLAMICFALVFAPLAVLALEHLQGQIKGVALLVLLAIFASIPMPSQPTGCRA